MAKKKKWLVNKYIAHMDYDNAYGKMVRVPDRTQKLHHKFFSASAKGIENAMRAATRWRNKKVREFWVTGEIEDMFEEVTAEHQDENEADLGSVVPLEKALRLYEDMKLIDIWKRAIGDRIQSELEMGNPVTGYKLVKKVKHKKWTDEIAAFDQLKGWEKLDDIAPRKLCTPNQAEKILGKMTAPKRAKFDALWIRPEGELTVAPESDKRPAEQPVVNLFDELVDEIDDLFDRSDSPEIGATKIEDDEL